MTAIEDYEQKAHIIFRGNITCKWCNQSCTDCRILLCIHSCWMYTSSCAKSILFIDSNRTYRGRGGVVGPPMTPSLLWWQSCLYNMHTYVQTMELTFGGPVVPDVYIMDAQWPGFWASILHDSSYSGKFYKRRKNDINNCFFFKKKSTLTMFTLKYMKELIYISCYSGEVITLLCGSKLPEATDYSVVQPMQETLVPGNVHVHTWTYISSC